MRHRGLETIPEGELVEAIARTPPDHYVIWTGEPCGAQVGSLRSRALACVAEVGQPVPLRVLVRRAAHLDGIGGLNPDAVRNAVRLHQTARPAAYLLVTRLASGAFAAVADIPFPAGTGRPIVAGAVVMDGLGRLLAHTGSCEAPARVA
jgi:hypothetical protein